jgi:hypothetical protein
MPPTQVLLISSDDAVRLRLQKNGSNRDFNPTGARHDPATSKKRDRDDHGDSSQRRAIGLGVWSVATKSAHYYLPCIHKSLIRWRSSMSITIQHAKTESELLEISRFWYQVYCVDRGVLRHKADHSNLVLEDPLMRDGTVTYARDSTGVCGTMMNTYLSNNALTDYFEFYELGRLAAKPSEISISTKFMVSRRLRGSSLAIRIMQETFRLGIKDGIAHSVFDCNAPLDKFFAGVGARDHAGLKFHPDFGHVNIMRLDIKADAECFRANTKNPLSICYQEATNEVI